MATVTYYFDAYSGTDNWTTNPANMVDGNTGTFASTTTRLTDYQDNTGNTCPGTDLGTITKVELRAYGYYQTSGGVNLRLIPRFGGSSNGDNHDLALGTSAAWTSWADITADTNAPGSWAWSDVDNLDVRVAGSWGTGSRTVYCAKIEIQVTYTASSAQTVDVDTLSAATAAQTLTVDPGTAYLDLDALVAGVAAQVVVVEPGAVYLDLSVQVGTTAAQTLVVEPGTATVDLGVVAANTTVETATVEPGAIAVDADLVSLTVSMPTLSAIPGAVFVDTDALAISTDVEVLAVEPGETILDLDTAATWVELPDFEVGVDVFADLDLQHVSSTAYTLFVLDGIPPDINVDVDELATTTSVLTLAPEGGATVVDIDAVLLSITSETTTIDPGIPPDRTVDVNEVSLASTVEDLDQSPILIPGRLTAPVLGYETLRITTMAVQLGISGHAPALAAISGQSTVIAALAPITGYTVYPAVGAPAGGWLSSSQPLAVISGIQTLAQARSSISGLQIGG